MDTLNLLNNYGQNRITKEALLHNGVTEEEIARLLELRAIRNTQISSIYVINLGVVQTLIATMVIGNDQVISREKLIHYGVADGTIRKMIKEGIIFTVSRGMYSVSRKASQDIKNMNSNEHIVEKEEKLPEISIKEEAVSSTVHLDITNDIMRKIEEGDLNSILEIIENTNGEEFVKLSKSLWKWVFTNILQNNQIKTTSVHEVQKEKTSPKVESVVEIKQEPIEEIVVKETSTISTDDNKVEKETPVITKTVEENKSEESKTGLSLEELWRLYYDNKHKNPVAARRFLEEIRDLSAELNIPFQYKELSIINEFVCGMDVSKSQLREEKSIRNELNSLFKQPNRTPSMVERIEELVSKFLNLYQDRGVQGNIYRGKYEAFKGNYKKAICFYNDVLDKQPWNFLANNELSYILFSLKDFSGCAAVIKNMLKYHPDFIPARTQLAKFYIERGPVQKLKELSQFEITDENKTNAISYFKSVIDMIQNKLDDLETIVTKSEITKEKRECYNALKEELANYIENYAQLLNYSDMEDEMIQNESRLASYESEVYYATVNEEDGSIMPAAFEKHISNLEITKEDEMLLYIAAAKVFFVNKLPKYGDYYLNKVGREKKKTDIVKEEYNQCVKNKKLYLNQ